MVVVDAVDERFGETGLTGLVEANLSSQAAVGHPGVAEPHQLLHVRLQGTA